MYFESIPIIALKNLLVQQTLFQLYIEERNFKCYPTSLFLFHVLFSHKVCLLSPIFISMNLCRNVLFIFPTSQVWQGISISRHQNCFLPSDMTHWALDGKPVAAEPSWASGKAASTPQAGLVTEMSKGPCYMEVSFISPERGGQLWYKVLKRAEYSTPKHNPIKKLWGCLSFPPPTKLATPCPAQRTLLYPSPGPRMSRNSKHQQSLPGATLFHYIIQISSINLGNVLWLSPFYGWKNKRRKFKRFS